MQTSPPVCLQVAQCLRRGTLEDEQTNLRDPAMNEVHTRQWTDTAEVEGIAQGVIQRESQYMGREKKIPSGQCRCSRVSQMPLLPSASRPHSLTLRVDRPIVIRPASLNTVRTMPRHVCLCHSNCAQRCEESFCTSVDIRFTTYSGASSLNV
jgi:hypothetical protein